MIGLIKNKERPRAYRVIPITVACAVMLAGCTSTNVNDDVGVASEVTRRAGLPTGAFESFDVSQSWVRERLRAVITEEDAIKIALLNNPRVVAEFSRLGVERSHMLQAGLLNNPVFSADINSNSTRTESELALAQPFLEIFMLAPRAAAAEDEYEAQRAVVIGELIRIVFEVRRACVEITYAQHVRRLVQSSVDVAEAATEIQRKLHAAGNVKDQQVTLDEVLESDLRLDLAGVTSQETRLREKLNVLLGAWGSDTTWTLKAELNQPVDVDMTTRLERRVIESSLGLRAARASANSAAQLAGVAGWDWSVGETSIGISKKRDSSAESEVGPIFSFSIPLFDAGQYRADGANALVRQRLAEYSALAIEIRAAARVLRERVLAANERLEYIRKVLVPLRARLTRETMRDFNAMQVGVFDVLMARREEIAAERMALGALSEARMASLDLLELVAGRFDRQVIESAATGSHEQKMKVERSGRHP